MYLIGICECLSLVNSILISVNLDFTGVSMRSRLGIIGPRAQIVTWVDYAGCFGSAGPMILRSSWGILEGTLLESF